MTASVLMTVPACAGGGHENGAAHQQSLGRLEAATGSATPGGSRPRRSAPTTLATPLDGRQADADAAARAVVNDYQQAYVGGLTDPARTGLGYYDKTAVGVALMERRNATAAVRSQRHHATGTIAVENLTTVAADLTNTPGAQPPVVPHVILQGCVDSSRFDVVDASGLSVRQRVDHRQLTKFHVYNYRYPDVTQWRVGRTEVLKGETC